MTAVHIGESTGGATYLSLRLQGRSHTSRSKGMRKTIEAVVTARLFPARKVCRRQDHPACSGRQKLQEFNFSKNLSTAEANLWNLGSVFGELNACNGIRTSAMTKRLPPECSNNSLS
mmetsp:Transcript_1547/g.3915  ORF Transcript_1547/g.3915 Transcript_1547/m.3915 type:complete len:117 (+) Transcript_1547:544-894(+)